MPEWLVPVSLAVLTITAGVVGYLVKSGIEGMKNRITFVEDENKTLREGVRESIRSLDQELYGAKGNNGMKAFLRELDDEIRYQGAVNHWSANLVTVIADKSGVVIRDDRPKRSDQR